MPQKPYRSFSEYLRELIGDLFFKDRFILMFLPLFILGLFVDSFVFATDEFPAQKLSAVITESLTFGVAAGSIIFVLMILTAASYSWIKNLDGVRITKPTGS